MWNPESPLEVRPAIHLAFPASRLAYSSFFQEREARETVRSGEAGLPHQSPAQPSGSYQGN